MSITVHSDAGDTIRVYHQPPQDIMLEIRRGRTVVNVSLSFTEAERLAYALTQELPDTWDGRER